ncbi:Hypothetical protein BROD_1017 [Brucella sp. NF 2653]|nr:Hypothetical protein BROD_1017 [Brucella sp. NF 2653]EPZ75178.1 hypothetical protein M798_15360 [Brucella melitensis ADMAS-G1]
MKFQCRLSGRHFRKIFFNMKLSGAALQRHLFVCLHF